MGTSDTKFFTKPGQGGVMLLADYPEIRGKVYWVHHDGSDSANYGVRPDIPFATLDYAIGKCTANNGDVIYVLPGHAEDIASGTALDLDVADVTVRGIGTGSRIPKFSLTTAAAATVNISAANVTLENVHVYSNVTDGITIGITVDATADGFVLRNIKMSEAANTKEFLKGISITANADDGLIEGLRYYGISGGTTSSAIIAAGGTDRTIIRDCFIDVDSSAAAVKLDGAASEQLQIMNNRVIQRDTGAGLGIACHASTTGMAVNNYITNLKDTVAGISGAAMAYHGNYGSNAVNAQGVLVPGEDS